jgi:hypothetical protein
LKLGTLAEKPAKVPTLGQVPEEPGGKANVGVITDKRGFADESVGQKGVHPEIALQRLVVPAIMPLGALDETVEIGKRESETEALDHLECSRQTVGDDLQVGSVTSVEQTESIGRAGARDKDALGLGGYFEVRQNVPIHGDRPSLLWVHEREKREPREIVVGAAVANAGLGVEADSGGCTGDPATASEGSRVALVTHVDRDFGLGELHQP